MQKGRALSKKQIIDFERRLDFIHDEFFGKHVRQVIEKYYNIRASSMRELYNYGVDIFITGNHYAIMKYGKELGSFIFNFPSMADDATPEVAEDVATTSPESTEEETLGEPACDAGETCEACQ